MKYVRGFVTFLFFLRVASHPLFATGHYQQGSGGFDISFPQCPALLPEDRYDFGIVGVNHGRSFTYNTCLFAEYFHAKKTKKPVSLYMNLNAPSGDMAALGGSGPAGTCRKDDSKCKSYNYGYYAAADAFSYARSQFATASLWWLDIETANIWSDTVAVNRPVLQGAIDFLSSEHILVGIYSTKREWRMVMGEGFIPKQNFTMAIPNWVGTGQDEVDAIRCVDPFLPGSPVWMIQYNKDGFDWNYVCL